MWWSVSITTTHLYSDLDLDPLWSCWSCFFWFSYLSFPSHVPGLVWPRHPEPWFSPPSPSALCSPFPLPANSPQVSPFAWKRSKLLLQSPLHIAIQDCFTSHQLRPFHCLYQITVHPQCRFHFDFSRESPSIRPTEAVVIHFSSKY